MKAVNTLLALLVTLAIFVLVAELGLRLIGLGPQATINRFDPELGWSKTPDSSGSRSTKEFDVTFDVNALGLRDDPMESPAKPDGTFRVLMLGDSFVQGYTVDRDDLFVDQLERWWQAEGRRVDVINAGTEGWSTDQEVLWLERNGAAFEPDLVLLFPYENDLYWNAKRSYTRFPKPRYHPEGRLEPRVLEDPGPSPWTSRFALTRLPSVFQGPPTFELASGGRLPSEWAAYLAEPPDFMDEAYARTKGALIALKRTCEELECDVFVVPIPAKAAVRADAGEALARAVAKRAPGLAEGAWSADRPVDTFLALAQEVGLPTLDARPALREAAGGHDALYFARDWHFDPAGNRAFARFLHDALAERGAIPQLWAATRQAELPEAPPAERGLPGWLIPYLVLWALLSALFLGTYRDEKLVAGVLKIGAFLALVFAIVILGSRLAGAIPPPFGTLVVVAFVIGILTFVLYKLGHRVATISELFASFVRRGHWYLMPLVVVLLTIGSLLVVAASSPLIAPFIYTLF